FVRSKCVIFQQGTDRHGNGSRLFAAFAGREPNGLPHHRLATEADDAGNLVRPHFAVNANHAPCPDSRGPVTAAGNLQAHGARALSPALARPGVAVACAQRDAYRELVEYCWRLVDAERKRLFKYTRPPP